MGLGHAFPSSSTASIGSRRRSTCCPYVPLAPLLIWVLGFERAKAGVLPTDAEHHELRRLLNEAMDAGGCGWSAQRLHPDGPGAVQRDYDGRPMVTDVMHDETALELAEVLAERNAGLHADDAGDGRRRARLHAHRGARRR